MVSWKDPIKTFTDRSRYGLRWEILVGLGLLMLAAVTFMGTTALKAAERAIILQKVESLTHVTRVIRSAVTRQWEAGGPDVEALNVLFRDMGPSTEILEFSVTDTRGRIITHSRGESIGRWTRDPILKKAIKTQRLIRPNEMDDETDGNEAWLDTLFSPAGSWTFAAPILVRKKPAGAFAVKYPLEGILVTLRVHRRILFSIALIDSLIIMVFGIWLIGRTAIKPILGISKGAQALASGEYDTRVQIKGPHEISLLAESFNTMAEKIQEAVKQQEEHSAALERSNLELISAQREMVRIEKLASVGQLASGIAHEIGNPLSAILGYAAILLREERDSESAQYLGYIEKETERIQRIISGLLEFSRPKDFEVEELKINDLLRSTIDLVSPQSIFRDITISVHLSSDDPVVSGDRHQLQQVFINIFLNAAQAMDGKGRLEIVSESTRVEAGTGPFRRRRAADFRKRSTDPHHEDYVAMRRSDQEVPSLKEGDPVVAFSIRDTGSGIPAGIVDRIFDPFFTTKPPGEGTGLGLAIAHGVIEAHGGRLWFENADDGGAVFRILLPEKR